ncbi:Protein of unknown function (DUF1706), partial [Snodgrassella alvi SCGC AB-598-P14]
SADDYQRKYDACKTDQCRIQVEKEYLKASDEANKIILNLYMTGQITEEESKILLTSYAKGTMMSAAQLVSYLIGWGELVLSWHKQEQSGQKIAFPEAGY